MKPVPAGWPRLSLALFYADPRRAIDFLCRAFGFEVRLLVEGKDGRVEHSELEFGEALVMVAGAGPEYQRPGQPWRAGFRGPSQIGGQSTASPCLYVDDAEAHCARARAAGAAIASEPMTHDYGSDYWSDRGYAAIDCEGHVWWFLQRLTTRGVAHG
ncbi:MAG: VOC family protein [Planctomycetota bacterium]